MRWHRDGFAVTTAIERNQPLPSWAEDEPAIAQDEEFYIRAFWDLSSCRSIGFGVGPIPWRDILLYAQTSELDCDLIQPFTKIIRSMDAAYLKWMEKERESKK